MLLSLSTYWKSLFETSAGLISDDRYDLFPIKQWIRRSWSEWNELLRMISIRWANTEISFRRITSRMSIKTSELQTVPAANQSREPLRLRPSLQSDSLSRSTAETLQKIMRVLSALLLVSAVSASVRGDFTGKSMLSDPAAALKHATELLF